MWDPRDGTPSSALPDPACGCCETLPVSVTLPMVPLLSSLGMPWMDSRMEGRWMDGCEAAAPTPRWERRQKGAALAGNRTRVNCLEGSYAHHYTTNAAVTPVFSLPPSFPPLPDCLQDLLSALNHGKELLREAFKLSPRLPRLLEN
ncbi:hypothetical protein TURU_030534 [Turdus rufiventris]|nr:hypothetical protein TURU_030534 [Turdus rufiventris]